jgi:hypothetical protein
LVPPLDRIDEPEVPAGKSRDRDHEKRPQGYMADPPTTEGAHFSLLAFDRSAMISDGASGVDGS